MRKIEIGQTITILANIGVIAGIIFLGIELQQNNKLLRAEAIGTVFETRLTRQDQILDGVDLAALIQRNVTQDELSPEDMMRVRAAASRSLIGWQRDYFLYKEGILPEEYFRANFSVMRNAIFGEGGAFSNRAHWEEWGNQAASQDYKRFIEECIASDCETIP